MDMGSYSMLYQIRDNVGVRNLHDLVRLRSECKDGSERAGISLNYHEGIDRVRAGLRLKALSSYARMDGRERLSLYELEEQIPLDTTARNDS